MHSPDTGQREREKPAPRRVKVRRQRKRQAGIAMQYSSSTIIHLCARGESAFSR